MARFAAKLKRRLLPLRDAGGGAGDQDDPPGPLPREFPSGIKLLCNPQDSAIDIVFVHGLTGNRDSTWTARDATEPWPQTLLPSVLTTARVLTFGYDAQVADWKGVVSQSRIANHAWNLLTSVASYRDNDDTNERPILFVCHSLGGLVCEDALVTSRQRQEPHLQNILRSTRGIIFLGTPHHGAGLARWAERLSRSIGLVKQTNSKIVDVLKRDSEVLARIQDSFHTMVMARTKEGLLPPIEITCFYEELPMHGVGLVVPPDSAILPGYIPIGIHGNHRNMTKFANAEDPGFKAVCGELRRWIRDVSAADSTQNNTPLSRNEDAGNQPGPSSQHGAGNRQFNNSGAGTMKIVEGNNYKATRDQNFVQHQHIYPENTDSKLCHVIPFHHNEAIVDRTHIFAQLDDLLPPESECGTAALYGLGGSGKTQVALEYAYRRCRRDPACSVFWVHADNETTFVQDYQSIAWRLGLDKLDGEALLRAVRDRIESRPSWLLVLDNADDLSLFGVGLASHNTSSRRSGGSKNFYNYVPRSSTGTVLWTSRDKRIVGTRVGAGRGVEVGKMSSGEAKTLLERSRSKKIASEEAVDAEKLLEELQWLPLAISQAGAYLRRTSTPINGYLSKLAKGKQRWRILKAAESDPHRRPNVPNSVLETWNISIERIRVDNMMAYRILHTIAYVSNQDIPFEIMAAAGSFGEEGGESDPDENEDRVLEAVTRLKEFSFIKPREDGGAMPSYEMHKLVQEATRYGLRVRGSEDEANFSNAALQVLLKLFPGPKREAWAECERYLAHAVQVGEWAEISQREVEVAHLLRRVSDNLFDRGRWREREPVDKRAYQLRREALGENHPDTLTSMGELATTYYEQGWYAKAELMEIKVLELRKEVLGEKHPDTITSMANLATTYSTQGRYSEAELMKIKVLELQKEVLGEKHPDTITSMGELAATYHGQGRYAEAESIKIKVLASSQEVLGGKHPDTIRSMANLATTYFEQGRYAEGEELSTKALALQREILGERHPDTLNSMHNLAVNWNSQGRQDSAIGLMEECLQLRRTVLGPDHPHTTISARVLMDWRVKQENQESQEVVHGSSLS